MKTLVKNADVFDGREPKLQKNVNIVANDDIVTEISAGEISEENFEQIIDARGHVVIPGLTDAHVHLDGGPSQGVSMRIDEVAVRSVRFAYDMLLRGFTTVRDAGGIVYGLKKNIDNGYLDGPRIFPSHSFISQTSGHGDSRESRASVRLFDHVYSSPNANLGRSIICDGAAEVLRGVRENLFLGASQIKIMAGGGCSSIYDPIQTVQFTLEEMKAAVDAASDFGTYVMAHLYTPASIQRAVKAGVKSLEHTNLMDDETGRIVADSGAYIMPGPQFGREYPKPDTSNMSKAEANEALKMSRKGDYVRAGEAAATEAVNKYDIPILFGTDSFGDPNRVDRCQLDDFRFFKKRFGTWKGLRAATGNINDLIKLTTYQNPYPDGKIGVLEEGSYADLLIIDGDPTKDLDILADRNNIKLIMKGAKVYKNLLP